MRRHLLTLAVVALLSVGTLARAAPPVEDYGKLPAIDHVSLSPSGDRLALVATVGDSRRLFIKSVSTGELLLNLPLDGVRFAGVEWAGDDHVLLFTTITLDGGQGFGNAYLNQVQRASVVDLTSHKGFDLFGKGGDVINAIFGTVHTAQIDGHWYAFATGLPGGDVPGMIGDPILFKVNLDSGERTIAARGNDTTRQWFVGPNGQIIARLEETKLGDWRVLAGQDGLVITSGRSKYAGAAIAGLGRTAGTLLIAEPVNDTSFTARIEEWPLAPGGKATEQVLPNDPLRLRFDRTSGLEIGQEIEGDAPAYSFFDQKITARFNGAKAAFSGVNVHLVSASEDFGRMVIFTDGGDDSGTYWLVDIATGKASILGEAYPTIGSADVGPVKMIEYQAADGLPIHAVLTLPPGREAKALPLIVMPHGGPIARDRPGFDWWAQVFASHGYAVLQPNFRGSDGYGETFIESGFGQWGRKMQTDLSDGVAYLGAQGIVDPKRTCIAGASYGGFAALAGVTLQHGVYRCAIAFAPVTDFAQFVGYKEDRYGESTETAGWDRFIGADTNKSAISPAAHVGEADAPVLLFHGRNDENVPMTQSQEMDSRMRGAGKVSKLIVFPDEPHSMSLESTRVTVAKESIDWVEKYNPSDPSK
jgi:dipeptidyl aminopeptidase/acylaminoacyl peptidase